MPQITWLDAEQAPQFPPTTLALDYPNGLLAAGGLLSPDWLLTGYFRGIFPWFNEGEPVLWWSPSPRMVLEPGGMHLSRSLRKAYRRQPVRLSANTAFKQVIEACQEPRDGQAGTWITEDMRSAYLALHNLGWAHSLEVWHDQELIGGLYGIGIDSVFYGESMFSRRTNASKFAFLGLSQWAWQQELTMIDCQVYNEHLERLGAQEIDRTIFERRLPSTLKPTPAPESNWLDAEVQRMMMGTPRVGSHPSSEPTASYSSLTNSRTR